jgi:hypothetical protein
MNLSLYLVYVHILHIDELTFSFLKLGFLNFGLHIIFPDHCQLLVVVLKILFSSIK